MDCRSGGAGSLLQAPCHRARPHLQCRFYGVFSVIHGAVEVGATLRRVAFRSDARWLMAQTDPDHANGHSRGVSKGRGVPGGDGGASAKPPRARCPLPARPPIVAAHRHCPSSLPACGLFRRAAVIEGVPALIGVMRVAPPRQRNPERWCRVSVPLRWQDRWQDWWQDRWRRARPDVTRGGATPGRLQGAGRAVRQSP